ncbi:hypothetical protein DTO195F2_7611 [Paecilomyces variotii]|nr:hypothetical protein DTO195F2_7611 [Paecilomyces variotii]KAJ9308259.1 hypothetical protein DTO217A2_2241 [Paecilomyces variotii]KAJ9373350.1 hypothetical protein DTO282E5_2086 [Paecilomyces variotii]
MSPDDQLLHVFNESVQKLLLPQIMSQSPHTYSPQPFVYSNTGTVRSPAIDPDTPPPPPPKPSSHEASRRGTPQTGPPLPRPPQSVSQAGAQGQTNSEGQPTAAYVPSTIEEVYDPNTEASQPQPPSIEECWLPDIVKDKSNTDLQTILSNPNLISALSTQHPSYAASQKPLYSLLESNKALANHLLELESHIANLRASTESLLLTHQSLEVSWRKKQAEMDAALAPWSPKALYQRLAAAVAEQEAVCQAVEESFLEGDHHGRASEKEVVDWVRRVRAEAAKLEARREARARWDEGRVGGWR